MSVLSDLGSLLSNIASLSVPGIVAASAYAIFLWPPLPVDTIEIVRPCSPTEGGSCSVGNGRTIDFPPYQREIEDSRYAEGAGRPACAFNGSFNLTQQQTIFDYQTAIRNQDILDSELQVLQQCQLTETARQGQENLLIADITAYVTKLNTDMASVDTAYQTYIATLNPLANHLASALDARKDEVWRWQAILAELTLFQQERTRRSQDLARQAKIITDRQADPGRLRPRQKFDDVIGSLGSHIAGFVTLALAWSLLLTPITQSGYSGLYSAVYKNKWDYVRIDRGPPIEILEEIAEQVSSGN
jgi:hypothetical protein